MKYLGIDFGLRRLGFAISEGELTAPLKVVKVLGFQDALKKTEEIVQSGEFNKIVVGLPEGKIGQTVLRFVLALKKKGLNVITSDETLSSQQALEKMIELGIPKHKRRLTDDKAAAIILQNYLDTV